ncbi:hypothetical protein C0995_010201 [Termitomyces sp. Mi166|nr:hypothetical protein C0995_010201 [Termitomyces sp. Mi166\
MAVAEEITMPFLTKTQSSGRRRKSNQEKPYPPTPKAFEEFLEQYKSIIPPTDYGNKSGSLWEDNDLLQLGVVIQLDQFWYCHPEGVVEVDDLMSRNPGLSVLLKALEKKDFQFPDAEILKKLRQSGASESVAVYCGLAGIQRKPPPKSTQTEDFKRWAGRLRERKKVRYAESSAEASDPTDLDFEYDEFSIIEEQAARIVDEAEANDTAVAFIRMILMAVQECQDTADGKPFPAVKRRVPTTLGTYTCWTDGSIVVKAFSPPTVWSLKVVVIAEIELNAQMYRIALEYKRSTAAKDYEDIPDTDRTVYLICMNGTHFRACWVTYKTEWLHSLFGPFSELGVATPTERKTRLDIQEFRITKSYLLDTINDRVDAASIILYIAFCVVRIGCNYNEVAHYTE